MTATSTRPTTEDAAATPTAVAAGKLFATPEDAIADLPDGASILVGGFGLSGNPEKLIAALAASGRRRLHILSNNCGNQGRGLAVLLQNRQVARWTGSFMGGNPDIQAQHAAGEVEVELVPQGTLAERIRAGGAGIPAFYTPTGAGTVVAEGKETRLFQGRPHILEHALTADFAFLRAAEADPYGNLRFHGTTKNFQPAMATAARVTIVEVERLLPLGSLPPEDVHLPGLFVHRLVLCPDHEDPIEHLRTRPRPGSPSGPPTAGR